MRVLITLLALALSASASDARPSRATVALDYARAVAERVVGPVPCENVIYTEAELGPFRQAEQRGCTIVLDTEWRTWGRKYLCAVVLHENYHVAGVPHSNDWRSVMYFDGIWRAPVCHYSNGLTLTYSNTTERTQ